MRSLLTLFTCLALASGCSNLPPADPANNNPPAAEAAPEVTTQAAPARAEVAERPFPDDSLYPLLVAEFALRRREYDVALSNYMTQAAQLKDAGVSAHTTRLAQFMQQDQAALEAGELWVELEPDSLEARLTLANLLARNGRGAAALPHMEYILRAGGLANFTAIARGFDQLSPPQQQSLLLAVQGLMADYPDNIQLRICQTLMLEEMGKLKLALSELQAVFRQDPNQLQAIVLDAKLRLDLGETEKVFTRIRQALEQEPGNDRLRLQYARMLTRTDLPAAEQQFQILAEQAPDDPDLLFSLALIQRETADLDAARENLEQLISMDVRTDEAHYYLGRTAEDQQRWESALMHYMQVQPGRDFGAATDRVARILLAAGRSAELQAWFDQLRHRYPTLAERLFAIEAEQLISAAHVAEAMALLNRALEEFPDSFSLRYSRAMLSEQLGNLQAAEQDLRRIIAMDPNNATALNALGYTLSNSTDRYIEADELITRALAIQPEEPAILDSMGWVKYRLGDLETALYYLRKAYSLMPDPEIAAHLGEVLWTAGDTEAATSLWQSVLLEHPEHRVLLETMQRFGIESAAE
jgi:tetratricopeptide (TPR) repeat protein